MSKRHKPTFEKIISELIRIGYKVEWKILNTKDYGIPQNRERVFFTCFRDVMDWYNFKWPEKEELKILLKDILEDEVDEKYSLSEAHLKRLLTSTDLEKSFSKSVEGNVCPSGRGMNGRVHGGNVSPTISTNKGEGPKIIQLNNPKHSNNRIYSKEGISPALNTMQGGHRQPFITTDFIIRKLTPKECFRLQGFLSDEVNVDGISNSQQYKLAGNGQSVNVVKRIFEEMFRHGKS